MKTLLFTTLFIWAFVIASCEKSMQTVSIQHELLEFDTVTFNSVFEVTLKQDTFNQLKIEGADKIVKDIAFDITNGHLTLKNNYKGNWVHPKNNKIKIFLTTNGLSRINANETCNIQSINTLTGGEIGLVMTSKLNEATLKVNCNSFYYWNNFPCGGKITLSGIANELKLWNVALMQVDAAELVCNIARIENASKGACKINCIQKLVYSITGEGNIYASGHPAEIVPMEISSSGQLILQ
jgi:hypothetical protein